MVSGKTPTGRINYTEIARNVNLKNSKGMSWMHYLLQVNNGKVFNTNIMYLNKIFQSNENNDKEKRNSDGLQLRLVTKINNLKRHF